VKKLDDYIMSFYDESLDAKIKSSKNVLELFQDFGNLEALLEHGNPQITQIRSSQSSAAPLARTTNAASTSASTSSRPSTSCRTTSSFRRC
jgi:hypothetical protein